MGRTRLPEKTLKEKNNRKYSVEEKLSSHDNTEDKDKKNIFCKMDFFFLSL